ncbi:Hypothetical protein ABZS17G119_01450 [Kosakonia cowanii]
MIGSAACNGKLTAAISATEQASFRLSVMVYPSFFYCLYQQLEKKA